MDFAAIGEAASESEVFSRPTIKGRKLQYDSDFGCYECAHLDESVSQNFKALVKHVEFKRKLAGAEKIFMHLTLGLKGGRHQIATVKEYQKERQNNNKEVKVRVRELRCLLANHRNKITIPVANLYQEADDSMAAYQNLDLENSVIMSGDKDLWMVEGLHCDQNSGRMYKVKGYGKVEYREVGNVKPKLVGEGTSWFWHQMLMGDGADTIAGLPKLCVELANRYVPTKKHNPKRKPIACGEVTAVAVLKNLRSDEQAARLVYSAYKGFYPNNAMEMLVEQAFLLWMRRTPAIDDCIKYLRECGLHADFSSKQRLALHKFQKLCVIQKGQGDF